MERRLVELGSRRGNLSFPAHRLWLSRSLVGFLPGPPSTVGVSQPLGPLPPVWEGGDWGAVTCPRFWSEPRWCQASGLWGPPIPGPSDAHPGPAVPGESTDPTSGEAPGDRARHVPLLSSVSWSAKGSGHSYLPSLSGEGQTIQYPHAPCSCPAGEAGLSRRLHGLLFSQLRTPARVQLCWGAGGRRRTQLSGQKGTPRPKSRPPPLAQRSVLRTPGRETGRQGNQSTG